MKISLPTTLQVSEPGRQEVKLRYPEWYSGFRHVVSSGPLYRPLATHHLVITFPDVGIFGVQFAQPFGPLRITWLSS